MKASMAELPTLNPIYVVRKLHFISNQYSLEFFEAINLCEILCGLQDFAVIIGADMNAALDPLFDRSGMSSQHTQPSTIALQGLVSDFSLTHLFRAVNPSS